MNGRQLGPIFNILIFFCPINYIDRATSNRPWEMKRHAVLVALATDHNKLDQNLNCKKNRHLWANTAEEPPMTFMTPVMTLAVGRINGHIMLPISFNRINVITYILLFGWAQKKFYVLIRKWCRAEKIQDHVTPPNIKGLLILLNMSTFFNMFIFPIFLFGNLFMCF